MMTRASDSTVRSAAQPLAGMRIVITRSADRSDGMATRLRALGAEPIVYPTIAFVPPADCGSLDAALSHAVAGEYDWLVLTSVTAVQFVHARLTQDGAVPHLNCRCAAVGPTTAEACSDLLGLPPALVPEKFIGTELAAAFGDVRDQRILLANADIAKGTLERHLRGAGAVVERVVAYHTVPASGGDVDMPALLAAGAIDALTFTSGSTARYFVQRIGPEALPAAQRTIIACIGPAAAAVAREVGLSPTVVADVSTEAGMVDALVEHIRGTL